MAINAVTAAQGTREVLENITAEKDLEGKSLEHAAWMLEEIVSKKIEGEKAHRWLGYAQGLLVLEGKATMADFREINELAHVNITQVQVGEDVKRHLNNLQDTNAALAAARDMCEHTNGATMGMWSWRIGQMDERLICDTCKMPVDDFFEDVTE